MSVAIITGSAGLIGSELARHFYEHGYDIWGIDNDMRKACFGAGASTLRMRDRLISDLPRYRHHDVDVRNRVEVDKIVAAAGTSVAFVVHAAAQPSHDWASQNIQADFAINASGTLNLLDSVHQHAPNAPFVFLSTNKVYGDLPNTLPLVESETRFDLSADHPYFRGIPVDMSMDRSAHSFFGVSKAAADLMVQEFGRKFGMSTLCLRAGCMTGPGHAGTELHGFLAYLVKCTVIRRPYTVYGYDGKQVRDNIHSADLATAVGAYLQKPRSAAVYNIGGGRESNCSMREAIELCEKLSGYPLNWSCRPEPRFGDHKWWISDLEPFQRDYPQWQIRYDVPAILADMFENNAEQWLAESA